MCDILIFGGTTEGRQLAEFCTEHRISAFVSVATDYGEQVLDPSDTITVIKGRMSVQHMTEFIFTHHIRTVIDATHPYATEVTQNIRSACHISSAEYIRVCRDRCEPCSYATYFQNIPSLIDYLNTKDGNILLTTGSKEAEHFTAVTDYQNRCIIRILPCQEHKQHCQRLGYRHIVARKPPFSVKDNTELIDKYDIRFLVTKESGKAGGFDSKLQSAEQRHIAVLVVSRPNDEGVSLAEVKTILSGKNHE